MTEDTPLHFDLPTVHRKKVTARVIEHIAHQNPTAHQLPGGRAVPHHRA
jgi:hypothetical protein